ncbi:chaperone modulator CbpM [Methylomarinum vadi]|uniref:chaperone modulator CbpM n=1 Tax=Methylomarinum vadi TaxID=438855 RepID=UPI0004DFC053|nr:chaperone modulator CbpM [Methylomarinum vadi]
MAKGDLLKLLSGEIFEEEIELSLADLCRACQLPAERVFELVEQGVIEPVGRDPARWRFQGISVRRVRCAQRLEQDLGVNVAGAALAIDLLEELERLRARLRRLEG